MKHFFALAVVLFSFSTCCLAGSLIFEGPGDRLPPDAETVTIRVYGQDLLSVVVLEVGLDFVSNVGGAVAGFKISTTDGNELFGGQAIVHNAARFPLIIPVYDESRTKAGMMFPDAPANIRSKTWLFSVTFDLTEQAAGNYAVAANSLLTHVDGYSGQIQFTTVSGSVVIGTVTWTVDDDGPASFASIQAAIDAAADGDTVLVKDGTYSGNGNRDIDFAGKDVCLRSENGPSGCVIDCGGTPAEPHRGFRFHSGEGSSARVEGFTITNGYADYGGAIRCEGSWPAIARCIIVGNTAAQSGGAIYCAAGSLPEIRGCLLAGNVAGDAGGAIACESASTPTILSSTIAGNTAGLSGGGIYCRDALATLAGCILWANSAPAGPQIALADTLTPAQLSVSYSDVPGGQAGVYVTDGCTLNWGAGNIDADPLFKDAPNGDHRPTQASPCINAGDPAYTAQPGETDLAGQARVQNGRIDAGAYEILSTRVLYVAAIPLDPLEDGSAAHPYNTIQKGIDAAAGGDTVLVGSGTYTGAGNRDIDFKGKAITVRSANGAASCTINVQNSPGKRAFYFHSGETAASVLDGFKIINGNAVTAVVPNGGGIYCTGASPTITNCIITNCTADDGGAIYAASSPAIANCTIKSNIANYSGGGIFLANSQAVIENNTIELNQARYAGARPWPAPNAFGGGAICAFDSAPAIRNNSIRFNSTPGAYSSGAAILCKNSAAAISGNQIISNSGTHGGSIICIGSPAPVICENTISKCEALSSALYGGGIGCYISHAVVTGNTISENAGGGIWARGSSVTITGNLITKNTTSYGGGIMCIGGAEHPPCSVVITQNTIAHNTANNSQGGGIACESAQLALTFEITDNTISDNYTGLFGGGMYISVCPGLVSGNTITRNVAKYLGGGAELWTTDVIFVGNTVTHNAANGTVPHSGPLWQGGGGIWFNRGLAGGPTISGNTITDNTSALDGGGIMAGQQSSAYTLPLISDNTITGNAAARNGEGIAVFPFPGVGYHTDVRVRNNTISNNTAGTSGGGIFCTEYSAGDVTSNTIMNNRVTTGSGGGIHCVAASAPLIESNTIDRNIATANGGGVLFADSAAVIKLNRITGNTAALGAGLHCTGGLVKEGEPTQWLSLAGNIIDRNVATGNGGGALISEASAKLTGNTIAHNTAASGGGLYCTIGSSSSTTLQPEIKNSIVWANSAAAGAQITVVNLSKLTIAYCDIPGGQPGIAGGSNIIWGLGNIDTDPLFADPTNSDYHLKSQFGRWNPAANAGSGAWAYDAVTSACIDAGDPAAGFSAEPMPNGGRLNIGAWGNTAQASKAGKWWTTPGDTNDDCAINILDLIFIRNRLNASPESGGTWKADVNEDGKINVLDLIMVRNRLNTTCSP